MDSQERDSVRQEAAASTHVSVQIQENLEEDAEPRNDLLERTAMLEEDNEVFPPDENRSDSNARIELERNARVDKELKKISSTNPAGTKESLNLPPRRSLRLTLPVARQKYQAALDELSTDLEEYLSLHKPQEFIQEDERPQANKRFKRMRNQWGTLENAAEDLLMLLVSNAYTFAQTEMKGQLNRVNERLTAIQLGHKEYFSEMSSTVICHDRLIDRLNFKENSVSSAAGSVRSRDNIGKSVVDLAIDNEEQNRLDELEIEERRIRRDCLLYTSPSPRD